MTQSSLERIVWFSIGQITECADPDKQKELITSLTRNLTEIHEKLLSEKDRLIKQIAQHEKEFAVTAEARKKRESIVRDLSTVINKHSRENGSNTPDFILGEIMMTCLEAFEAASLRREKWYGKALSINDDAVPGERGDIRKPSAENTSDRTSPVAAMDQVKKQFPPGGQVNTNTEIKDLRNTIKVAREHGFTGAVVATMIAQVDELEEYIKHLLQFARFKTYGDEHHHIKAH